MADDKLYLITEEQLKDAEYYGLIVTDELKKIRSHPYNPQYGILCNGCPPKPCSCSGCAKEKERCEHRPYAKGDHICRYFTPSQTEREKVLDELIDWMKERYDLPALKEKIEELRQEGKVEK